MGEAFRATFMKQGLEVGTWPSTPTSLMSPWWITIFPKRPHRGTIEQMAQAGGFTATKFAEALAICPECAVRSMPFVRTRTK